MTVSDMAVGDMTLDEFPTQNAEPGPGNRVPPQDIAAEQSVLGAMLLSKDAIADVVETIRQDDFYRPAHQAVFGAITDLFTRGEPADAVTIANSLSRAGELERIGGAVYLHTLVAGVPTAANAGYYAQIVRERSILRKLVTAGTRIVQLGYDGEGDVDKVVDSAQSEVFEVTSNRASEDYLPLAEIMDDAVTEIEGIASRSGEMVGIPTGFIDLDRLTNGLHPGQLIILAARPAIGKALALDTPLPTPDGWTSMGQVQVGDRVIGVDGRTVNVVAATEVMNDHECFLVQFSDGSEIVADADHQWMTECEGSSDVRTTRELSVIAKHPERLALHALPQVSTMVGGDPQLPTGPYSLGVWLAGAACRINPHDSDSQEIAMFVEGEGAALGDLKDAVRPTGIVGSPHIPRTYLRAPETQRRALLAGLLDRAGWTDDAGSVHLAPTTRRLAQDLFELLVTLGIPPRVIPASAEPKDESSGAAVPSETSLPSATVSFESDEQVFRLSDKNLRHKELRALSHRDDRRRITAVTEVPSVPVRCVEVDSDDHLFLAGRSMVPTHNSTLGLDIARSASLKHGLTSVIFSLEMSRNEIVMRLLSAEAQIPLQNMRSGKMNDPEWRKIAARQGAMHEAPLFVDDSPNMTMTEIRAKCRRLKQRHDLRLVVVDYLQLMQSGKKVESRQQEVSEFSRSMKLLAKELDVPVIAISQLNRGPEARNDKKPMLSDLRESGCLTADTRVLRADTGAESTLGELYASGARDTPVWSLDESLRYRARTMTHVFKTGHREVFQVRMRSGRVLKATANHPLLTYGGWRAVGDVAKGSRVAVPRHVPAPVEGSQMDADEIVLLAHMLGDGSFVRRQPIRYASVSEENLQAVAHAATRRFGIKPTRDEQPQARATTLRLPAPHRLTRGRRNPIAEWLDTWNLFGKRSHEKFIPEPVFGLSKEQTALFLRHLWATDGCLRSNSDGRSGQIYYATTSRRLADGVARLLLRFGIIARIGIGRKRGYRDCYQVAVSGADDQKIFLRRVGGFGPKSASAREALAVLCDVRSNTNVDTLPHEVWDDVRHIFADQGMTHREFQAAIVTPYCGSTLFRSAPSRERLARLAQVLDSSELELLATNDVHWDEITSIESLGFEDVFDATVVGTHNFVADGVVVHNSLEQDADMVLLIHREDAYDKESSRVGEADLIVAKHRNGPTDTITVSFQGHYSRFVDMARE